MVDGDVSHLRPGHVVRCDGHLLPWRGARNPGERSRSGDAPLFYVSSPQLVRVVGYRPFDQTVSGCVEGVVLALRARVNRVVRQLYSDPARGVIVALFLGNRDLLSPRLRRALEDSGTYHFLAISGLHVGLLLAWLSRLPLPLAVRVAALALFALLTGAAPPVTRAALMLSLPALAGLAKRGCRPLDGFAWTAVVLLAFKPEWLADVGFQLSATAVLAILVWTARLGPAPDWRFPRETRRAHGRGWLARLGVRSVSRVALWSRRSLAVSAAASFGTAPLILFYFQRLHPLGIVWNLIVYPPVVALLLAAGLSLLAGSVHPSLGAPFAAIASAIVWVLDGVLPGLADVPGSVIRLPPPPAWLAMLGVGSFLSISLVTLRSARRRSARRRSHAAVIALALTVPCAVALPLSGWISKTPQAPEIWFFDVGAGSAHLVRMPGGDNLLVDAGSSDRGTGLGDRLTRSLLALGIRRLGGLILTHKDADHTNGVLDLLDRIDVDQIWVSPYFEAFDEGRELADELRRRGLRVTTLSRGARVHGGNPVHDRGRSPVHDRGRGPVHDRGRSPVHDRGRSPVHDRGRGPVHDRGRGGSIPWTLRVLYPAAGETLPLRRRSNETSFVLELDVDGRRVLLTADIEEQGTARLLALQEDLRADLLVYPHHGRRNELIGELLAAVRPHAVVLSASREANAVAAAKLLESRDIEVGATWRDGAVRAVLDPEEGWKIERPYAKE